MAKMHSAPGPREIIAAALAGQLPDEAQALRLEQATLGQLLPVSEQLTLAATGRVVSYSRKVFIPLTQLCRDVCHYCTFAKAPRRLPSAYLSPREVLAIARAGAAAGCKEALFTLGDKPELRYAAGPRAHWPSSAFASTLDYLERVARAGARRDRAAAAPESRACMERADLARLRPVSLPRWA